MLRTTETRRVMGYPICRWACYVRIRYRRYFQSPFQNRSTSVERGFSIAKPHLKAAARNIASDVVTNALSRTYNANKSEGQNGKGLMVMSRGSFKPPGMRMRRGSGRVKKVKRTSKKRTVAIRSQRTRAKRVKKAVRRKRPLNSIF